MGSREDEMCRKDMEEEYAKMNQLVSRGKVHIFEKGGHPAVASNAEKFASIALHFIIG